MKQGRMLLRTEGREAFESLLRAGDGDAALLYAYLAIHPACTDNMAASALKWDMTRLGKARGLLLAFGLASDDMAPPPKGEAQYHPAELSAAREGDPGFNGLCNYMEAALGRILRKSELETLLGVYETLNLSPDVLVLLISWCREEGQLSARNFEKWAYRWHDLGLHTFAAAESFLEDWRLKNDRYGRILRIFGWDRRPSDSEKAYMDAWADKGITIELIRAAYDEMTGCIGRFNWAYLNKILLNWAAEGVKTTKQAKERVKTAPQNKGETVETAILRKMAEKRTARERALAERLDEMRRCSPAFMDNERALRLCASRAARSQGAARGEAEREREELMERQTAILRALNKPDNWLDDKPDCPLCGDRGYIGTRKCQCLLKALRQAEEPAQV